MSLAGATVSAGRATGGDVSGPPRHQRSVTLGASASQRSTMSVRINQPVESVALEPFCFVRDDRGGLISADDSRISYTWFRSSVMWDCSCYQCRSGKGCVHKDDPSRRYPVQCATCAKRDVPLAPSLFCSSKCMGRFWAAHHACRHSCPPGRGDSASGAGSGAGAGAGAGGGSAGDERKGGEEGARLGGNPDDDEDERQIDTLKELPLPRTAGEEWTAVSEGRTYAPTKADVGHKLKVVCKAVLSDELTLSEEVETKFVQATAPPPPVRKPLSRSAPPPGVKVIDSALGFRIVTYNMLAEIYATQSQYPYCPMWALQFRYRRKLVLEELRRYDSDIICLQEVQTDHFNSFLYHELLSAGYEGLYKQKTRAAMGREGKVDGCALFFRKSRFALREKYVIEFNDAAEAMYNGKNSTLPQHQRDVLLKRLKRGNVAQVVVLEMTHDAAGERTKTPFRICVANTHLSWNPEYDDVKLWQVHMLIKELEKFIVSRKLPLVLCGDFNSDPRSSVYKLLSSNRDGKRYAGMPREDLPRDPCSILRGKIAHALTLDSAFRSFSGSDPEFTNYTGDFVGCLDYAWITTEQLLVQQLLEIPTRAILTKFSQSALPNPQFPSDHVALVFDMMPVTSPPRSAAAAPAFVPGRGLGAGAPSSMGLSAAAANATPHSVSSWT